MKSIVFVAVFVLFYFTCADSLVAECGCMVSNLYVMSELLSQLSSVRSRALGGPHNVSHFSQLEMQLSSSRFVCPRCLSTDTVCASSTAL